MKCAVDAIQGAGGVLDGLFLDATPKVDKSGDILAWGHMVDELRAKLGSDAIILDNGFFLAKSGIGYAGREAWAHTGVCYVESMASIGANPARNFGELPSPYDLDVQHLRWLADASAANPHQIFVGHGEIDIPSAMPRASSTNLSDVFRFGLVKYMLVTSSMENGYYLANNNGYEIDGGLLDQPMSVYTGSGVGCGEPTESFRIVNVSSRDADQSTAISYALSRQFQHGHVELNLVSHTSIIACSPSA